MFRTFSSPEGQKPLTALELQAHFSTSAGDRGITYPQGYPQPYPPTPPHNIHRKANPDMPRSGKCTCHLPGNETARTNAGTHAPESRSYGHREQALRTCVSRLLTAVIPKEPSGQITKMRGPSLQSPRPARSEQSFIREQQLPHHDRMHSEWSRSIYRRASLDCPQLL